jgi:ribosomal protein S18 acetylase RimI-like enzyme
MQDLFGVSEIFVGEKDAQIVGCAGFRGDMVTWLFVDPDHYRNGYGTALLTFILERMGPTARLNVGGAGSVAAISLYESEGFGITERFEGSCNGSPTKALRMVRTET